ncbi:MAG: DUF2169 domain-containing protein [Sandaracinaceae bacterium]|nr:DUF2169 domain-containing protein [Sandaracinaceae bacterium]
MQVVKDSPLSIAWVTFPVRPPVQTLVVVVKATFDLVAAGPCPLSAEQTLVTGDAFWDDDVERSVRWDSDLAIAKPEGEWWVTGLWRPSAARTVTHAVLDVRVGAQHKRVAIIGDRWWNKGMLAGATPPRPLEAVPLSLDRAFGGAGHAANPWGLGLAPDPDDPEGRVRLPNLEDAASPLASASDRPRVASLFPIPRAHPARMALTGTYTGDYMATRWPYFPADFQWSHFQAAPPDQRLRGFFRGDEPIEAEGLHPEHPRVRCRLPGIAPRVFLHPTGGAPGSPLTHVPMVLDTIAIDATDAKVHAVWRGHVEGVRETLEDVSHVFLVHEPIERVGTVGEYRAWFDRKLAEEADEEAAFEPAPPPPDEATVVTALPSAEQLAAWDAEAAASEEAAAIAEQAPVDPIDALRADMRADGIPEDVIETLLPRVSAPPPDPAAVAREEAAALEAAIAAAREVGDPSLVAALEAAREPPPEEPPPEAPSAEPPPEPPPLTGRQAVERDLAAGASFAGAIFAAVDLSGLDFSGRDLARAVLARCDLRGCRFAGANLDGASLEASALDGAVFDGASLAGANLDRVHGEGVSFRGARLEDAHAEAASLARADLRGAQAARAEILRCRLTEACFDGANLDGAELGGCELTRARFVDASLVDAWLDAGVVAHGAELEGANLHLLRAYGSDFSDAHFKWAKADGARFGGSRLDRANFSFADLAKADFAGASCVQALFLAVQAPRAVFDRAVLVGAQLGRANLLEASFMEANLHHADLRGANLFRAELYRARTEDARLELANLEGTKLEGR